ncbi:hypothetical protein vBCtySFA88_00007 [Clostridium phage vB_CtyS-FA88]|nr:hypothetical protein vBCtySFA88_00007 [Clostridium phage vB_CtyS-FA88]
MNIKKMVAGLMIGLSVMVGTVGLNTTVHAEKEAPYNMAQIGSIKQNVPQFKTWKITLTRPINTKKLDGIWMQCVDGSTVPIKITTSKDKKTLYIKNLKAYHKGKLYTVMLINLVSKDGYKMYPYCFRFVVTK